MTIGAMKAGEATRGAMPRPIVIDTARIFIQLASYRDPECQWTIRDAFEKARHPDRIFIGLCWQSVPETDAALFQVETRPSQVRRVDFHADQAEGLGWARMQAQRLWEGEEFTLQIDSHMRFAPDWDVTVLEQLEACPSPWPVLTVYPPPYWPPDRLDTQLDATRFIQAPKNFSPNGILQFHLQHAPDSVPILGPKPTSGVAGGFLFGPSRILEDVPSDPLIYFEGEEPNLAVRLWTHGFDLFSPSLPIVYHYYLRSETRRVWDDANPTAPNAKSMHRMAQLLQETAPLGRFGLGTARSLEDYELFAGVSFRSRSVAAYAHYYPHVFTPEMASALVGPAAPQPADGAGLLFLGQEGLLFSPEHKALYHLPPDATFIWCGIEEGMTCREIAAALAERSGGGFDRTEQRLHAQICHWLGLGLLRAPELAFPEPEPTSTPTRRWPIRPPPEARVVDFELQLLGQQVLVRCYDPADAAVITELLSVLPSATGNGPRQVIEVLRVGPYRYVVRQDLHPPAMVLDPAYLGAAVWAALDASLDDDPNAMLHLRAISIDTGQGATLLLGDGLALGILAASLHLQPLGGAGDLAGHLGRVEPGLYAGMRTEVSRDGTARPVPAPMLAPYHVHATWRDRIGLPEVLALHQGFFADPVAVVPYQQPATEPGRTVSRLVQLRAGTGDPRLVPIKPVDALRHLLEANTSPTPLPTLEAAADLLDWLERIACFELTAADAAAAMLALDCKSSPGERAL